MTYYGRWTYKYEEAARRGAAGVFIVHETGRPVIRTRGAGLPRRAIRPGDARQEHGARDHRRLAVARHGASRLLKIAGQDFDALKKQATTREFKPVPLGLTASLAVKNTLRTIESRNVLAKLEGSDPQLKDEYVVYSAHWDHLGVAKRRRRRQDLQRRARQRVWRGQVLEIARAFTQVQPAPRRSILFLMVTAEEQGLLGSQYYSVTPLYPLAKTLANINIDGFNQWGRTKDITVIGLGASDLDDYLARGGEPNRAARSARSRAGERVLLPIRSLQFREAGRARALHGHAASSTSARPPEYSEQKRDEYTAKSTTTSRRTRSSPTGI